MKENLTYRDYVVHIFTGVLFNVFLLVVFLPLLPANWWQYDLQNSLIWSLAAIPILFLEGHFILSINRFFRVELLKWHFILLVKRYRHNNGKNGNSSTNGDSDIKLENLDGNATDNKRLCSLLPRYFVEKYHDELSKKNSAENDETVEKTNEGIHYRKAAYNLRMKWYDELYKKRKWLFLFLFASRIIGQKVIKKDKDGPLVKTEKEENKARSVRYYVLSDFFKGTGCASFIAGLLALWQTNWFAVGVMLFIYCLSKQRQRCFSILYVSNAYTKKKEKAKDDGQNG